MRKLSLVPTPPTRAEACPGCAGSGCEACALDGTHVAYLEQQLRDQIAGIPDVQLVEVAFDAALAFARRFSSPDARYVRALLETFQARAEAWGRGEL